MHHQGPSGSIENDKVLLEGWWKKRGGKGHINQKTGKHRYFILTPRYLDWYEKPGYKRTGTVSLEQIYVRKQPDNVTLVVGQFGGKEFKITSEGQDPETRVEEWYKDIQKAMDNAKKVDKKTVVNEGFDAKKKTSRDSSPDRKISITSESTPQVLSTTPEPSPAVPQTQSAPQLQTPLDHQQSQMMPQQQQQSQIMPPQQPQMQQMMPQQQQQSQIMPPQQQQMQQMMAQQQQQSQMMPQMQQQVQMMSQVQTPMMPQQVSGQIQMQTSYQQPMMQTVVQPQMVPGVTYTQQIPTMNTMATTSYSPFGVQQTTYGTPVGVVSQTICMACRRPFPMIPGQMMRCPYCQFVAGGATTVVQQVPMGTPVFY
jgi:hypothetical protein